MMDFKSWKILNESLGSATLLGLSAGPQPIGGAIGAQWAPAEVAQDAVAEAPKKVAPADDFVDSKEDDMDDMDDDHDDDDMEDGDKDGDEDKDMGKSKKSKCKCDCEDCSEKGDHKEHGHDKKEESNYFGNGMDTFFCSCGTKDPKDGMCTKCSKYVVAENYSRQNMIDDALRFYRGDQSSLYKAASYLTNGYKPGKQLVESAIEEIEVSLQSRQEKGYKEGFADLMNLGWQLVNMDA
jgi:hypothetical protein